MVSYRIYGMILSIYLNLMGIFTIFVQVQIISDNLDIANVNSVNLRAAMSAALLLLPSKFTEV